MSKGGGWAWADFVIRQEKEQGKAQKWVRIPSVGQRLKLLEN